MRFIKYLSKTLHSSFSYKDMYTWFLFHWRSCFLASQHRCLEMAPLVRMNKAELNLMKHIISRLGNTLLFTLVNVMILTSIYTYEYILPPPPDPKPFQRYSLNTKKENCHSRTSYHLGICIWRTPCHTITNPLLLLVVAAPHRVVLKQVIFCLYFIKGSHVLV